MTEAKPTVFIVDDDPDVRDQAVGTVDLEGCQKIQCGGEGVHCESQRLHETLHGFETGFIIIDNRDRWQSGPPVEPPTISDVSGAWITGRG